MEFSMQLPLVTVVIPHFNQLAALDLCLESLVRQSYPRGRINIIVADNASPIAREALLATIADRACLVVVTERGAGPARNGGVAAAKGQVLAFIDADCVADERWIAAGVASLADYDFVGGEVRVGHRGARPSAVEAFEMEFAFNFKRYITKEGFTGSGNMFVSAAVFDQVGGFQADVSEDVEWSRRATQLGFRLGYVKDAIVTHPARETWAELTEKWRRINEESLLLAARSKSQSAKWLMRTWVVPLTALVHTPRVLTSRKLPGTAAKMGALRILFLHRLWRFGHGNALALRQWIGR
jgi:GT2 family glycosyltransferase